MENFDINFSIKNRVKRPDFKHFKEADNLNSNVNKIDHVDIKNLILHIAFIHNFQWSAMLYTQKRSQWKYVGLKPMCFMINNYTRKLYFRELWEKIVFEIKKNFLNK